MAETRIDSLEGEDHIFSFSTHCLRAKLIACSPRSTCLLYSSVLKYLTLERVCSSRASKPFTWITNSKAADAKSAAFLFTVEHHSSCAFRAELPLQIRTSRMLLRRVRYRGTVGHGGVT